jgi:hypothetical protein
MAKRKKPPKPPPERISVDWRSYQPKDARYWMFGGPYIEPDDIPPAKHDASDIGFHLKPGARRKWAEKCKADFERQLKDAIRRYVGVKTHGKLGISRWIWEHWEQQVHGCSKVPGRDPDPVQVALALGYRDIAHYKGKILACDAAIAEVDRINAPLFFGRG